MRKIIQLLHIKVATSYQNGTVRKIYNHLTGSPGSFKSLILHAMVSLILLPFTAPQWSRFYLLQGLIVVCNIKNQSEESAMVSTSTR